MYLLYRCITQFIVGGWMASWVSLLHDVLLYCCSTQGCEYVDRFVPVVCCVSARIRGLFFFCHFFSPALPAPRWHESGALFVIFVEVEASMEAVEASMEARKHPWKRWKLPWKRGSFHRNVRTSIAEEISTEFSSGSFRGSIDGNFRGNFHES